MRPRTLLVEDDDAVREVLCRAFVRDGWDVHASALPSEAIAAVAVVQFDVIVSDVMLPEMSGFQLASRLTELQPQARVIFISGYPVEKMREAKWVGEILQKPFRTVDLTNRADHLVSRRPLTIAPALD
jgi:CheY-like chemotaxis protein